MNAYLFALKNVADKLRKTISEPAMLPFYWQTYVLSRREKVEPDIYIVSYPKCGRTWLRIMLQEYVELLYKGSRQFHDKSLLGIPGDGIIKFEHDLGSWVPAPPPLSRLHFNRSKYQNKQVVFITRDPRDVVVSSWHHLTYRENIYRKPISDFIEDDLVGIRKIVRFMNMWIENREVPGGFYLMTYEQLHKDSLSSFQGMLEFLGFPVMADLLQQSVERGSFDQMKRMELKGSLREPWMKPGKKGIEKSMKVRSGKVGGYHESLSGRDIDRINRVIADELSPLFPYH